MEFILFYFNYTPLYLASSEDHTNIVRILLECPNIDVNSATYVPKFLLTMKFLLSMFFYEISLKFFIIQLCIMQLKTVI